MFGSSIRDRYLFTVMFPSLTRRKHNGARQAGRGFYSGSKYSYFGASKCPCPPQQEKHTSYAGTLSQTNTVSRAPNSPCFRSPKMSRSRSKNRTSYARTLSQTGTVSPAPNSSVFGASKCHLFHTNFGRPYCKPKPAPV